MNAPPPASAIRAAIHGNGRDPLFGSMESGAGSELSPNSGCGAGSVATSRGIDGVIGCESAGMGEPETDRAVDAGDCDADRAEAGAPVVGFAAASAGTASPLRGVAVAVVAGWAGVVAAPSAGRVTLPCRSKSRSWEGPIVSADGGGAAVTSTGASLFWADTGATTANAKAAPKPPKTQFFTRRTAVILPRPACWMKPRRLAPRPALLVAPLLAAN